MLSDIPRRHNCFLTLSPRTHDPLEPNFRKTIKKSEFLRKEIEYLGHVVTDEGH